MIGRLPVEPQPWVGRSSRRGRSRPLCRRQEREMEQDCQLQTACELPGRREEEAKECLKESLVCALKTEEHASCRDNHRHLPGTEEEDPVVAAGIPAGSHPRHCRQTAACLSCQPAARSRSRNPRHRPRQLAAGQAHPRRRQGCQDR